MLIRTQKSLHGWRQFLIDVLDQIKKANVINTKAVLGKYPPESVGNDKPAWVTYEEDGIVNNFIDELANRKVSFEGTDEEMAEFILRFILGQLGHDWEQTIIMKNFDYLRLFEE